jgi:hypothetical protein
MQPDGKQPIKITREELYRRVWETPMQRLAAEYGVSDNGLAKICARLDIPCPPRGYWAKIAGGQKVGKVALPSAKPNTSREATITPTPPKPSKPAIPPETDEQRQWRENVLRDVSKITVPRTLDDPHPLIAKWIASTPRGDRSYSSRKSQPYMSHLAPLEARRYRILDTLFKEFDRRGFIIDNDWHERFRVLIGGLKVQFTIDEHIRQIRQRVTAEDKKSSYYYGQPYARHRCRPASPSYGRARKSCSFWLQCWRPLARGAMSIRRWDCRHE